MSRTIPIILAMLLLFSVQPACALQGPKCSEILPHLEAGHILLTDKNYPKWKRDNLSLHVLGLSDSSCTECCQTESLLAQLKEKFDSKVYTGNKGKKI